MKSRCVLARENRGTFLAVYIARVRVTVQADGATVIREGHCTGEGRSTAPGEVHDISLKAAETDATKRALATFGRPFGLELYRGGRATVVRQTPLPSAPAMAALAPIGTHATGPVSEQQDQVARPANAGAPAASRVGFHPDHTTLIPRPSHYYGRRHQNPIARHFRDQRRHAERTMELSSRTPLSPAPPLSPGRSPSSPPVASTRASSPLPSPNGCVTRRTSDTWPHSPVSSAAGNLRSASPAVCPTTGHRS